MMTWHGHESRWRKDRLPISVHLRRSSRVGVRVGLRERHYARIGIQLTLWWYIPLFALWARLAAHAPLVWIRMGRGSQSQSGLVVRSYSTGGIVVIRMELMRSTWRSRISPTMW